MRRTLFRRFLNQGGKKSPFELGTIGVRNEEAMAPAKLSDNLHIPYPAEEIARRMTKIRLRHQRCEDRIEQQLLQGEYKYFTGKKISYDGADLPELISLLQNFGYFGFYSTVALNDVIEQLKIRVEHMDCDKIERVMRHLTTLHKFDSDLFDDMSFRLLKILPSASLEDVTGIIAVLQYMKSTSSELIVPLVKKCMEKSVLPQLLPEHIASLAMILGRQPDRSDIVLQYGNDILCVFALRLGGDKKKQSVKTATFTPTECVQTLWGLSNVSPSLPSKDLIDAVFVRLLKSAETSPEDVGAFMETCEKLSYYDEEVVIELTRWTMSHAKEFWVTETTQAMSYLAKASMHSQDLSVVADAVFVLLNHIEGTLHRMAADF
eukprot:PhF_6_TR25279/c0_g1_i2/m.34846